MTSHKRLNHNSLGYPYSYKGILSLEDALNNRHRFVKSIKELPNKCLALVNIKNYQLVLPESQSEGRRLMKILKIVPGSILLAISIK